MSKLLSVKMNEEIFLTAERFVKRFHSNRNAYINRAVRLLNRLEERRMIRDELRKESRALNSESQAILREFEEFQDEGLG